MIPVDRHNAKFELEIKFAIINEFLKSLPESDDTYLLDLVNEYLSGMDVNHFYRAEIIDFMHEKQSVYGNVQIVKTHPDFDDGIYFFANDFEHRSVRSIIYAKPEQITYLDKIISIRMDGYSLTLYFEDLNKKWSTNKNVLEKMCYDY